MSYILDALRRANSERERGTVPTLNADPGPADLAPEDEEQDGPAARRPGSAWIGAGIAVAAMALVAIVLLWPAREPAPAPIVAVSPQPLPPPAAAIEAPVPMPAPATVPLSVPPLLDPARPQAAAPAPSKPAVMAAEARLPTRAELPEDIRKQLPPITTSGAMYSDTPASRMVIINGQVLHEGDKLTPDLVLEQIMLKGAVLSFKGQRFSISY